jgi:hypothetical protein
MTDIGEMKRSVSKPAARWANDRLLCGHFFTGK